MKGLVERSARSGGLRSDLHLDPSLDLPDSIYRKFGPGEASPDRECADPRSQSITCSDPRKVFD